MNLLIKEQSGVIVVSITGRIDHVTGEILTTELEPILQECKEGAKPVLLDFSNVEYISSAGLRVLMNASRKVKAQKGILAIASLPPLVYEVFAISRFNLIIPCYVSVEAACKVLTS